MFGNEVKGPLDSLETCVRTRDILVIDFDLNEGKYQLVDILENLSEPKKVFLPYRFYTI